MAERRLYDPKAMLGVAHGIAFPGEGPLWWKSFNGGEQLRDLGFEIVTE